MSPAADVYIVDSTIRSLQSAVSGSRHSVDDLVQIGLAIDLLGVREIIINLQWLGGLEVMAQLREARPRASLVGTLAPACDASTEDYSAALRAGADIVSLETSPSTDYLVRIAERAIADGRGISRSFGEPLPYQRLIDEIRLATAAGYRSVALHDSFFRQTVTPESVRALVAALRRDVPECPPIYIHLSDFYGMATASAVAAVTAGAAAIDACMNNTGHHCGHTSLSEVVMILEDLYGISTGIDIGLLAHTARVVSQKTGVPIPLNRPIVGDFAFAIDGAVWSREMALPEERRVHTRFPYPPQRVGSHARLVWSERTMSGEVMESLLRAHGMDAHRDAVDACLARLAQWGSAHSAYPHWLTDEEIEELCRLAVGAYRG